MGLVLPVINTILLLSSGITITLAHHYILIGQQNNFIFNLFLTIILGFFFLICQGYEYKYGLDFSWKEDIYGTTFFITTGFHGLHVTIGTIFLIYCLIRTFIEVLTHNRIYLIHSLLLDELLAILSQKVKIKQQLFIKRFNEISKYSLNLFIFHKEILFSNYKEYKKILFLKYKFIVEQICFYYKNSLNESLILKINLIVELLYKLTEKVNQLLSIDYLSIAYLIKISKL